MIALTYVVPGWWPWATAVFAVVAVVSGWLLIRGTHPHLPRRMRVSLWALRVIAGALLLLCTLDWRSESTREDSDKPMLRVLVDKSASMAVKDAAGGRSRYEDAVDQVATVVRPKWNDPARLETFFAGDGLSTGDPVTVVPDAPRSALGRSLREALEQTGVQSLGGVLLLTDGAASDPEDLRASARLYRTARVPVFPWIMGTTSQPADVRIVSARLRQPSPAQASVHLEMTIESPGNEGKETSLTVKFSGQTLLQQTVRLDGKRQEVSADFVSPYLGCHFYDIELTPLEGESVVENNRTRAACDLHRDPIRVLYMEGSEPHESSYLRDGLEADPEMSVTCLHFPGQGSVESLAAQAIAIRGKDERVFYDGQGREVPSVCHKTRGFPATLEQLLKYDVVIDSDIIKEAFSPQQLADTVAFVEQFGGGFVMVGGQTSFGAGGYETTVIDKLMPVEIANKSDPMWFPFQVKVTEAGLTHPVMKVGANPAETTAAWSARFPGFQGANYARRAKPGAHVLARVEAPGTAMNELVLFAVQNIGHGRTMAFMSDTTSSWGSSFETVWGESRTDAKYYRKFWNNAIRWLAADRIARKGGQAVIETPSAEVTVGDTVAVRVAALSAADLPGLELNVREGEEAPRVVPLQWDGARRSWEGFFTPKGAGDVLIEAAYKNTEGTPVVTRSGVVVRAKGDETIAVAARPDLMAELAQETGGTVMDAANIDKVLGDLASRSVPVVWKRSLPVWDRWWVLLPLLLVVVAEWLVRRKLEPVGRR
ncbi:glutamine amidotransferase [Luteolibacter sp. LG18]|uniref:glutamine amidotransferase n=1 Tax=Luteolibacter sp. LG18 TaxID=2819286 RepID=UPI002B308278|nr:hypothetical protein llg_33980 [Luteolibacter sp. LG18]